MRRILRALVAFTIGSAVLAASAEAVLRLTQPELGSHTRRHSLLGWSAEEYIKFDPAEPEPADGVLRLLALGDSFLKNNYIMAGVDARFPAALQRRHPERVTARVLAAEGWGTDQQLLAFHAKGRAWQPDVVVLAFCANNDLANILSVTGGGGTRKAYFVLGEDSALTLHRKDGVALSAIPDEMRVVESPTRSSFLASFVRRELAARGLTDSTFARDVDPRYRLYQGRETTGMVDLVELPDALDWSPQDGVNTLSSYLAEDFELNTYQWSLLEAILAELDREVTAVGAELVVFMLPMTLKPQDLELVSGSGLEHVFQTPSGPITLRMNEPGERLTEICARLGVAFFDPSVEFRDVIFRRNLAADVWPVLHNRHFSLEGHLLLADMLEEFLREELGLLQDE